MKKVLNAIFVFLSGIFIVLLSSCVDLSGVAHHPTTHHRTPKKSYGHAKVAHYDKKLTKAQRKKAEVHTMLGGLGMFSTGMYTLRDSCAKRFHVPASTIMWYNAGEVCKDITKYRQMHDDNRPIVLMGHSLGANEQIKVARTLKKAGIRVDLLVTIDAVSQDRVPSNVDCAYNVYKPGFIPMISGLQLKADDPKQTRVENINVNEINGINVNHFTIDKNPMVQAMILDKVKKVLHEHRRTIS